MPTRSGQVRISQLLLTLILVLSSIPVFASSPQYALIIDAGSTGSRIHLFQYETESSLPVIHELFSENVKPGLSSFAEHPEQAGPSLKALLDDASQELKKHQASPEKVSLSILATAGMRLLPENTQDLIYKELSVYLVNHYKFPIAEIRTLPGQLEGIYGWLDVNYLGHHFDNKNDNTVGSIDMGGASTQIVFSTEDESKADESTALTIGQKTYTVYSKSFLSLGLSKARSDMNNYLLANTCYPANYPLSESSSGHFNFANCSTIYQELIDKQQVRQVLPLPDKDFIAYAGAYYTFQFFDLLKNPEQHQVKSRVNSVCMRSWDELKKVYPGEDEKILSTYCANGVYLTNLLFSTYQLDGSRLTVTKKINQQDIDWTLGALLYQLVTHA